MKKSVYIVGGGLVICVIAIALIFGFGRGLGIMRANAVNSNTTTAQTSGNVQTTTKTVAANNAVINLDSIAKSTVNGNDQTVTTTLDGGVYASIVVQKDVPVKWTITAKNGDINSCNNEMIIKDYNVDEKLKVGENVIEFTPTQSGTITYSCWMGMVRSNIIVVDDLNNITNQDISGYSSSAGSSTGSGCSVCQNSGNI